MRHTRLLAPAAILIAALVLGISSAWTSSVAQEKRIEALRWEYLVSEDLPTQEAFNKKGNEGWELAGISARGNTIYTIFKRSKK
jgi:hypothetical protein